MNDEKTPPSVLALQNARRSLINRQKERQIGLDNTRAELERATQRVENLKREASQYEHMIKEGKDQVAEYDWAIRLIEKAITVDHEFLTEVWAEND